MFQLNSNITDNIKGVKLKRTAKYILKTVLRITGLRTVLIKIKTHIYENNKKRQTLKLIPTLVPLESVKSPRYIVSLTSYGERLANTAPYAIITLLNQNVKPDKIVLWVANEDKQNIPQIMNKLIEKGLDIRFCEDIKSYKKLIPALDSFPDEYIITADDDVYYPKNWLEQLIVEHRNNPRKIICHRAHGIKVDENHNPIPYRQWDTCIKPESYFAQVFVSQEQSVLRHQPESVFPTGVGGILYPPKCFHRDITNKELYIKIAPYADDIWFWAMAVTNKEYFGEKSPYIVVENGFSKNANLSLIDSRQARKGNALANYNRLKNGNEKQLKAVIEQYPQIRDIFGKIDGFDSAVYWEERYAFGKNSGDGSYNQFG